MIAPGAITLPTKPDEVTHHQYLRACEGIQRCAAGLRTCDADEAAEHWLPSLTEQVAIVFAYVAVNMTARNLGVLVTTQQALALAKDVVTEPQPQEERDGGISDTGPFGDAAERDGAVDRGAVPAGVLHKRDAGPGGPV